jgi:hypothetical protein
MAVDFIALRLRSQSLTSARQEALGTASRLVTLLRY